MDTYVQTEKLNASYLMDQKGFQTTFDPDIYYNIDE